jgi:hypothetical protein
MSFDGFDLTPFPRPHTNIDNDIRKYIQLVRWR